MKKDSRTHEEVLRTLLKCALELANLPAKNPATFFNFSKEKDSFPDLKTFGKFQLKQLEVAFNLVTIAMGGMTSCVGAKEFLFKQKQMQGIYLDFGREIVGIVGLPPATAEAVLIIFKIYTDNKEDILSSDDLFNFLENNHKTFASNSMIKPLFDEFSKNFFSEKIMEELLDTGDGYFDTVYDMAQKMTSFDGKHFTPRSQEA